MERRQGAHAPCVRFAGIFAGVFVNKADAGRDAREPPTRCRRSQLRQHTFRHVPRMQFNPESVDLNHRISGAKLLRFS
jgi:hypothetical protein